MRCRSLLGLALVVASCGRVGFVPGTADDARPEVDAAQIDASPAPTGCADGEREGFTDVARYPDIASCAASWGGGQDLRSAPTGTACGDDLGPCIVPADACAAGWHICGADGSLLELKAIGVRACDGDAGTGRFAAAVSHCPAQDVGTCPATTNDTLPCFPTGWCGEPVCCGTTCLAASCLDGVYPGATRLCTEPGIRTAGCAEMTAAETTGVLCCRAR